VVTSRSLCLEEGNNHLRCNSGLRDLLQHSFVISNEVLSIFENSRPFVKIAQHRQLRKTGLRSPVGSGCGRRGNDIGSIIISLDAAGGAIDLEKMSHEQDVNSEKRTKSYRADFSSRRKFSYQY
jgi:hypothetical protein